MTMNFVSVAVGIVLAIMSMLLLIRQTDVVQPSVATRFVMAPAYIGRAIGLASRSGLVFALVGFVTSYIAWWALSRFVLGAVSRSDRRATLYACMVLFASLWGAGAYLGQR